MKRNYKKMLWNFDTPWDKPVEKFEPAGYVPGTMALYLAILFGSVLLFDWALMTSLGFPPADEGRLTEISLRLTLFVAIAGRMFFYKQLKQFTMKRFLVATGVFLSALGLMFLTLT